MTHETHTRAASPKGSLQWLIEVLGGEVDGPSIPMLARPNSANPELLIPLSSSAVSAAALTRRHDGRSLREQAISELALLVTRTGQLRRIGGEVVDFPATATMKLIATELGLSGLTPAIGIGPPRRNRKPSVMLITPAGRTVAYAKIGWSALTRNLVANEFDWLQRLDGRVPEPFVIPSPLLSTETPSGPDGATKTIVMTPLPGNRGRKYPQLEASEIKSLARSLGTRRRKVADLSWLAPPNSQGSPEDDLSKRLAAAVVRVRDQHAQVELETGLWHGDLNRWNTVTSGDSLGVFDWEFAGADRPVGQDYLHIQFETLRRSGHRTPNEAIETFLQQMDTERDPQRTVAIDVYLADLALRESRLSGQGWDGPMAGYREPLVETLEDRLAP
ncbi:MAG: phosphotransferase [Acidimicrobiales bacterium]|nr:phosphotransferase [Acidimicrobiales bacterium]